MTLVRRFGRLGVVSLLVLSVALVTTLQGASAADAGSLAATWQWRPLILAAQQRYNVPAGLIQAVMAVESSGQANAVSSAGAIGLMQVMPMHFASTQNASDPATNIYMGAKILRDCENAAGGWHPGDNWVPAINCYNTGHVIWGWTSYSAAVRAAWVQLAAQGA